MRKIDKIVIHCSASPDSIDFSAADIDRWHKERGWSGIGYHYVIRRSGKLELGRPDSKIGAHVAGHNKNSLGICLIGTEQFTNSQIAELYRLVKELMNKYVLDIDSVYGHKELFPGKDCPNLDMNHVRANLLFKPITKVEMEVKQKEERNFYAELTKFLEKLFS